MSRRKATPQWKSAASRRLRKMAGNVEQVADAVQIVVGRLLRDVSCPPTDLEALGRLVRIREFVAEPLPISGELRRVDGGFCVAYSSYLSPGRRKFTIAHEIAHAIFEMSGPNCPRSGKELERLCDMMATEILMPREVFLEQCGKPGMVSWEKISDLARLFQTSLSATSLRCAELYGMTLFEIEEDRITWGYGAVRQGPIAKLDLSLQETITHAKRREIYSDRICVWTEHTTQSWWNFESKSLAGGKRIIILMRHLGQRVDEDELIIPKSGD